MITTYEEAEQALRDAEHDVAADFGEDMVDQAYGDLVESICTMITDEKLMAEVIRTKLGYIPSWAPGNVKELIAETWERMGLHDFG